MHLPFTFESAQDILRIVKVAHCQLYDGCMKKAPFAFKESDITNAA